MGLFDVNNSFWQFLNKMADQFLLSLLWFLCSIPIITFGASTAAFISASTKLYLNEDGNLTHDFFSAFKANFVRSTGMGISQLILFILLAADLRICYIMQQRVGYFLLAILAVLSLFCLAASFFTWTYVNNSKASILKIWKTAFFTAAAYLPHSVAMLVLAVLGVFATLRFSYLAILLPCLVIYQYARVYAWIWRRDGRIRAMLGAEDVADSH